MLVQASHSRGDFCLCTLSTCVSGKFHSKLQSKLGNRTISNTACKRMQVGHSDRSFTLRTKIESGTQLHRWT